MTPARLEDIEYDHIEEYSHTWMDRNAHPKPCVICELLTALREAQRELEDETKWQTVDAWENDLHKLLDELGITRSHYELPATHDGYVARLRSYVERVRATMGEISAVPKKDWDALCAERQRSLQYSQEQQRKYDALQRRVEALEKALCSRGYHIPTEHPRMWWQGNYYVTEGGTERGPCDFCEAALRGEEAGT